MTVFQTLLKLNRMRRALGITWAEALREGLHGLERYQQLDREFEAQRDAKRMVAGRGGQGEPPAVAPHTTVHHY